jgi:HK97 family phage portal protein
MSMFNPLSWFRQKANQPISTSEPTPLRFGVVMGAGLPAATERGITDPEYLRAYTQNVFVYACIEAIAQPASSVALLVEQKTGRGQDEWELVPEDHELVALLSYISSDDNWHRFVHDTIGFLELMGNAYWYILRVGGRPVALQMIPPDRIRAIPGVGKKSKKVSGYSIRDDVEYDRRVPDTDIIHFRTWSPLSDIYGMSPIAPLEEGLNADRASRRMNTAILNRGGIPAGVLTATEELDEDDKKALRTQFEQSRSSSSAGTPLILGSGLEYKSIGIKPDETLVINLGAKTRDEICAGFHVPPAIVGSFEDANYSNSQIQRKLLWTDGICPMLDLIADCITQDLCPQFEEIGGIELRVRFDTSGIEALQEDKRAVAEQAEVLVNKGLMTINEVREQLLNLPPVPWGDSWWASGIVSEVDGTTPPVSIGGPTAPPAPIPAPAPAPKALPEAPPVEEPKPRYFSITEDTKVRTFRLQPEHVRREQFKAHGERLDAYIPKFKSAYGDWLSKMETIVKANIESHATSLKTYDIGGRQIRIKAFDPEVLVWDDDEGDALSMALMPIFGAALKDSGTQAIASMGVGLDFDLQNPRAQQILQDRTVQMNTVQATAQDRVRTSLAEGLANHETIEQLTDRVSQWAVEGREGWAETVARTEAASSLNMGALEGYKQAGAQGKTWLAEIDAVTREEHADLDGVTVGIDEQFSCGGEDCDGPGDPGLSPELVINCRCSCSGSWEED